MYAYAIAHKGGKNIRYFTGKDMSTEMEALRYLFGCTENGEEARIFILSDGRYYREGSYTGPLLVQWVPQEGCFHLIREGSTSDYAPIVAENTVAMKYCSRFMGGCECCPFRNPEDANPCVVYAHAKK